jgi:regulator of nonsense transcripts 1
MAAASRTLDRVKFTHALIDECTQAVEPECLIPLVKGVEHVVLVGDHQQLSPMVMCKPAEAAGFGRSMFERMRELHPTKTYMLDVS